MATEKVDCSEYLDLLQPLSHLDPKETRIAISLLVLQILLERRRLDSLSEQGE